IDLLIVWALCICPVDNKDYNIEIFLFVLISFAKSNSDSQAVFVKNNYSIE
ncbi:9519_t:CDS:1, partial [Gigaspora rosea]